MGFLFLPVMPMGLRWAALRAAGAQEQLTKLFDLLIMSPFLYGIEIDLGSGISR